MNKKQYITSVNKKSIVLYNKILFFLLYLQYFCAMYIKEGFNFFRVKRKRPTIYIKTSHDGYLTLIQITQWVKQVCSKTQTQQKSSLNDGVSK